MARRRFLPGLQGLKPWLFKSLHVAAKAPTHNAVNLKEASFKGQQSKADLESMSF